MILLPFPHRIDTQHRLNQPVEMLEVHLSSAKVMLNNLLLSFVNLLHAEEGVQVLDCSSALDDTVQAVPQKLEGLSGFLQGVFEDFHFLLYELVAHFEGDILGLLEFHVSGGVEYEFVAVKFELI